MPEILTESFCERCGTRYTFESARPKARLKGVRVLSRGLKNFVLSDDTTLDEAMAAARSETDREVSAHQLDAFHKTFNFCMSCRQYTCPNCWNEVEARCQSCAPLANEVLSASSPALASLAETAVDAVPWPIGNGHQHDAPTFEVEPAALGNAESEPPAAESAGKASSQTTGLLHRFRPGQSIDDELAAYERSQDREIEAQAELEPAAAIEAARTEAEPATGPIGAADEAEVETPEPELAAGAETVASELEHAGMTEAEPAPVAIAEAEPEPVAIAEAEPEPEPVELLVAEPEPEPVAAFVAEPVPEPEPQPIAATPAADVVEQPTWRITAPDVEAPAPVPGATDATPLQAPATPVPPVEPQWPAKPEWPTPQASAGLPFLGRPSQPQGGIEALWAASNRELVSTPPAPGPGRPSSGIQPCISCGLSLSANARFCRRCGTLQGG